MATGNQRIQVLKDIGMTTAPCVVVQLDDVHARLLAQALNRVGLITRQYLGNAAIPVRRQLLTHRFKAVGLLGCRFQSILQGEDYLGLRAELVREVLEALPKEEILSLLPETAESLEALSSLGQENMADYLQNWQRAQQARLKHLQFQLTPAQLEVVQEALAQYLPQAKQSQGENPNARGTALYLLCKYYLGGARV